MFSLAKTKQVKPRKPLVSGTVAVLVSLIFATPVLAADMTVDLVLPPTLEKADAPFYRGAKVKMGDALVPVREGKLPKDQLAAFVPEENAVIISDSKAATEADKGQALLGVIDALQAGAVAPAAGRE